MEVNVENTKVNRIHSVGYDGSKTSRECGSISTPWIA
jgi:hypothetical protein